MSQERHPIEAEIHPLLAQRWSPRAFSGESLSTATLRQLFEAARWAPSSMNEQPWRFIVARRDERDAFERIFNCLSESNRRWAGSAGALVVAVAARFSTRSGRENGSARYDLGQAVAHLTVQAMAAGLYVHQMGGFSADAAREALAIPEGFDPVVAIAIGRLGDPSTLAETDREREASTRSRRALAETVFAGSWGQSAPFTDSAG
ncbi:MAG TPA: nitroreductase family protein [Anaerolineales bacterium]|nr:nitroreductase family protein [Anaerolineales bacterium]